MISWTRTVPVPSRSLRVRASQDRLHAGEEHPGAEGLGHVIVGAELQARHDVGLLALGREHDDGDALRRLVGLEHPADLEPVEAGQHQVEDDEIGPVGAGGLDGLLAGADRYDIVAVLREIVPDKLEDILFIIDDQYLLSRHGAP